MKAEEIVARIMEKSHRLMSGYVGFTEKDSITKDCICLILEYKDECLKKAVDNAELRKWAVEQAVKTGNPDVSNEASKILEFVLEERRRESYGV